MVYIRKRKDESEIVLEFVHKDEIYKINLSDDYDLETRRLDDGGYEVIELEDLRSYLFNYFIQFFDCFARYDEYLCKLNIFQKMILKLKSEDAVYSDYLKWRSNYLDDLYDNFHYYFEIMSYPTDKLDNLAIYFTIEGESLYRSCSYSHPLHDYTSKSKEEKETLVDRLNNLLNCDHLEDEEDYYEYD